MVDSDLDSLSRSVLVDACELVNELDDSVGEASFGSGHFLRFQAASSGWKCCVCGCLAGVLLRMLLWSSQSCS